MANGNGNIELQIRNSAFRNRLRTFAVVNNHCHIDVKVFLNSAFPIYKTQIGSAIRLNGMVKSTAIFVAEFEKRITRVNQNENSDDNESDDDDDEVNGLIKQTLYFTTPSKMLTLATNLNEHYKRNVIDEVVRSVEDTAIRGSNFTLSRIIELNVQVSSYHPL